MDVKEMINTLLEAGFSQEAIAFGANVHKSSISRIVTGKTHSPRCHLTNSVEEIFLKYGSKN